MASAFLAACNPAPARTSSQATRLPASDSLALATIATTRGEEVGALNPEMLETIAESSRVVHGLVYYRSVYRPRGSAHMESVVILAQRDTQLLVLRTPEDFVAVSDGWIPNGPVGAARFCGELATAVGQASTSLTRPVVFENGDEWRSMGFPPPGPLWRSRVAPPKVARVAGRYIAQLWVAEPGRMARYECKVQAGASPWLEVVDSIPGAGFPPDKP